MPLVEGTINVMTLVSLRAGSFSACGKWFWRIALFLLAACMVLPQMQGAPPPASTTTTLTLSSSEVAPRTIVTLTASVAAGAPVTVGQVNFCDADAAYCTDAHILGSAQLTSGGTAVLRLTPGIGNHNYKAIFSGTGGAAASTSSISALTVTGSYATTTSILESGSPGNYTLSGTVTAAGIISPTGALSLLDTSNSDSQLGSATLIAGTASLGASNFWNFSGSGAYAVGVGDFNGDGHPDLAIAYYSSATVQVLLGNGDGTFTAGETLSTGSGPAFVVVSDFNGDGNPDLGVVNATGNSLTVLLGNGDGTFTAAPTQQTGGQPQNAFAGDFNGDGNVDLAVANYSSHTVSILLGNGDGTFIAAPDVQAGGGPSALALGDLNGDGKTDIVIANYSNNTIAVMLGNGDGTFTGAPTNPSPVEVPNDVVVGDFNGDGNADIAVASNNGYLSVQLGNGDGTFTPAANVTLPNSPEYLAVDDFNCDGKADLAVDNSASSVIILLGNGDGTFTQATTLATGPNPAVIALGDFNGDGLPDIVTANYASDDASILLTNLMQTATASASNISLAGVGTHQVEASYPGDGTYGSSVSATIGLAAMEPTTLTLTSTPTGSSYGQQVLLTVSLNPYTAQGQSTNGETVTFYNGGISLGAALLTNGAAMLDIPSLPIGTADLYVSFAGDANFEASTSNVIAYTVVADPSTVSFSVPNQIYGSAPFTVSATSNSPGAITYAVVSGPATMAGSTVTLTGVGTVVLRASQAPFGNYAAATQNASFTVAGEAPTISFSVPNRTYGGAPFPVSATSNSTGTITYAVVSGPATISGSTVTLTGAGTVLLSASQGAAGDYAAATQNTSFTVAGGAPTISFSVPNQTYGGAPFAVSASSNSGGTFTYAVLSGPATLSGSTVTLTGTGIVVLNASQAVAGNYAAGTQTTSFTVGAEAPAISFSVPEQTYGVAPFTVNASSNSPGAITYAVVSGPATISGATVTLTGIGNVVLSASQAASGNYAAGVTTSAFAVSATTFVLAPAGGGGSGFASATASVPPGGQATYAFTLAPGAGTTFPVTITFTASGLPPGATYSFSPAAIAAGSTETTTTLIIQTAAAATTAAMERLAGLGTVAYSLFLLPFAGCRRVRDAARRMPCASVLLSVLALGALCGLSGCGGGSTVGDTPQTYHITVTATGGGVTQSTNVILVEQ